MNIKQTFPSDVISAVMNSRLRFLFSKYRIEPSGITIYRNPNTNKLEHFNASGTFIFERARGGDTIVEIVDHLIEKYNLDRESSEDFVTKDILRFVRNLEHKGLLEVF
jgi:hypothetical protein